MKQTATIPQLSAVAVALMSITGVAGAQEKGPSSSQPSFVVPSVPGVTTTAIMTVGDSVNKKPDGVTPYVMVGIPDGLGAYDNHNGTFTVLMNHEIPVNVAGGVATPLGEPRAHGNAGAFVSMWTIRKSDLSVLKVEDIIPNITSIFLSNNNPSTGVAHSGYLAGATTAMSPNLLGGFGGAKCVSLARPRYPGRLRHVGPDLPRRRGVGRRRYFDRRPAAISARSRKYTSVGSGH